MTIYTQIINGIIRLSLTGGGGWVAHVVDPQNTAARSSSWWVNDNGTVRPPNGGEIAARESEENQQQIANLEAAVEAYINTQIGPRMERELALSRALLQDNTATAVDLPAADAVQTWLNGIYGLVGDAAAATGTFNAQKNWILADDDNVATEDFTGFGAVGQTFEDLNTERETFIGSL